MDDLVVTPEVVIAATELEWSAARSSGPGGQNVNKVATKVELRFDFEASPALTQGVKARLRTLAASRLDAAGRVLIVSQLTRDQSRNLEDARQKLAELVRAALIVPKRRKKTRPSRAARERRLNEKKRQSEKKQTRRFRDP